MDPAFVSAWAMANVVAGGAFRALRLRCSAVLFLLLLLNAFAGVSLALWARLALDVQLGPFPTG